MKVITISNQKGGVGKTTIAVNLAIAFSKDNYKTLLVDADTQKSSIEFREVRSEYEELVQFSAIENTSRTLHKDLRQMKDSFDIIIIDSGGRDSDSFRSSFLAADIVIVPITPGSLDAWGTERTLEIINISKDFNENLEAYVLMNMVKANTRIEKDLIDLAQAFENEYNTISFQSLLMDRITYKYSAAKGRSITEMDGKNIDEKAVNEFMFFYNDLKGALNV